MLPVFVFEPKKVEMGQFFHLGCGWPNEYVRVFDHDFPSAGLGKAIPYGVCDLGANEDFVLLATGADTGELACDAILRWWDRLGRQRYEDARCWYWPTPGAAKGIA